MRTGSLHVGALAHWSIYGEHRSTGQPGTSPGGKHLLTEAVAGEGPGLAHQGPDDVAVVDPGFSLAPDPLHSFHQVALVVHFQMLGVQPDLDLLPDEPGGHGVGAAGCLDGAPLAHPGPVVDVLRHRSWRQALQMRAFLLQLFLYQPVAPVDHLDDEAGVIVDRVEFAAAPQYQGLVDGVLEPEVCLLGDAVFVGFPELISVDSSPQWSRGSA